MKVADGRLFNVAVLWGIATLIILDIESVTMDCQMHLFWFLSRKQLAVSGIFGIIYIRRSMRKGTATQAEKEKENEHEEYHHNQEAEVRQRAF